MSSWLLVFSDRASAQMLSCPPSTDAVAERTVVEASSLDVVAREARVTVRFTADAVNDAIPIAEHAVARVRGLAQAGAWRLTERVGGRWFRRV